MSKTANVDSLTKDSKLNKHLKSNTLIFRRRGGKTRKKNSRGGKTRSKRQRGGKTRSKRQRGGNPDDQDEKDTYLFDAIAINDYDKVEKALTEGANVNRQVDYFPEDGYDDDPEVITPLIHAIISGDYYMVELLLYHEDMDIVLDLETNTELALAENRTPEGEDQNGIPYMIEEYIVMKNNIKDHRYKNIKQLQHSINRKAEERKNTIPSLAVMAAASLTSEQKQKLHRESLNVNEETGQLEAYYGGKRKTRKSKKSKRKSKKSKRKSKRH